MKQLLLCCLLLLCSCATSRKVRDYLAEKERQPEAEAIVADWLEQHRQWYADKAAQDFPAQQSAAAPETTRVLVPIVLQGDSIPYPVAAAGTAPARRRYTPAAECPEVPFYQKTIQAQEQALQQRQAETKAAQAALRQERASHDATRQRLRQTQAQRDYWKEKNRKKFWALIGMAVCAVLYVVFKALAARVRVT